MSTLAKTETPMTVEDAVAFGVSAIEQEFPYIVPFTKERIAMWVESLREFEPTIIAQACKACIDESSRPPVKADVIKACREFTQFGKLQDKETKRLSVEDDPFPESDATETIGKALAAGDGSVNSKMLSIQTALMCRAQSEGKTSWRGLGGKDKFYRETCRNGYPADEQVIRNHIHEFAGVPFSQIPALVDKILKEETDPFANERN
jgi:hypothetical protein